MTEVVVLSANTDPLTSVLNYCNAVINPPIGDKISDIKVNSTVAGIDIDICLSSLED